MLLKKSHTQDFDHMQETSECNNSDDDSLQDQNE